jgi:hypothetical protein
MVMPMQGKGLMADWRWALGHCYCHGGLSSGYGHRGISAILHWEEGYEVEVHLESIELNGETLRRAQTALARRSRSQPRDKTTVGSADGSKGGGAEIEPESKEEPFFTHTRRSTGALNVNSPCGQRPGVASRSQGPSDDTLETNSSPGSGISSESKREKQVLGHGSVCGRGRHVGGVSLYGRNFISGPRKG